jgi:hypothetical protein
MSTTKRVLPRAAPEPEVELPAEPAEPAEPALPSAFHHLAAELLLSADVPKTPGWQPAIPAQPLRNVGRMQCMHSKNEIEAHLGRALTWADVDAARSHLGIRSPARFPRDRNFP